MKLKKIIIIALFGTFIVACNKQKIDKDFMVGTWQTTYLKMEMPTYMQSDSLNVYEDKFDNNPKLIAQSKYNADGSFSAWFLNPEGEKISNSNGKWQLKNDSLFVTFYYNDRNLNVSYLIEENETGFVAKSKYDWDEDGEFDDFLIMKTKRLNTK